MCAQGCEKSYSYETTQKKSWKDFKLLLLDDLKALCNLKLEVQFSSV